MKHSLRYSVNCSILFTERPLLECPAAANQAGFEALEFWWPFAEVVPSDAGPEAIAAEVLLEPISGANDNPLLTAADAIAVAGRVRDRFGPVNIGLLVDLYHPSVNGDDVDRIIADFGHRVGHVQIADNPGRNELGTGGLPLMRYLESLDESATRGGSAPGIYPEPSVRKSFDWVARSAAVGQDARPQPASAHE